MFQWYLRRVAHIHEHTNQKIVSPQYYHIRFTLCKISLQKSALELAEKGTIKVYKYIGHIGCVQAYFTTKI